MATLLGGNKDQAFISRSAKDRENNIFTSKAFLLSMALNFFLAGLSGYVGSLPREVPVFLSRQSDGTTMPYTESVTGEKASYYKMLSDWIGAERLACNDAKSMCARQTFALIPGGPNDDVARQVGQYNQSVADDGLTVTPMIHAVTGSDKDYRVTWDEKRLTRMGGTSNHAMIAYITIAFDQHYANLHGDPLMNPYGMYITSLRMIDVTGNAGDSK